MQDSNENKVNIVLIRHGATEGNLKKRYIGRTDEELCAAGVSEVKEREYPKVDMVISSPMKRCMQSAALIYPSIEAVIVENFRETDFGDFEGKNYKDLDGDKDYQAWIDSNGTLPFPNGESREQCDARILGAFERCLNDLPEGVGSVALVVHGGTIMTIMSHLTGKDYYDFHVGNGEYIETCVTI